MKPASRIYTYFSQKVSSSYAPLWLGVLFLLEIGLFIPLDAVLMLFCLENRSKRFLYAAIAVVASTMSGVVGYFLGLFLWDHIGSFVLTHLVSQDFFARLVTKYEHYEHAVVFIGSALPFPFKAIALSAGFCKVSFFSFVTAVFLARFCRFFFLAHVLGIWGIQVKSFMERHFHRVLYVVAAKIVIIGLLLWIIGSK